MLFPIYYVGLPPLGYFLNIEIIRLGCLLTDLCSKLVRPTENFTLLNYLPPFYFEVQATAFRSNGKTALQLID